MGVQISRNFGPLTDEQVLPSVSDWGRVGRLARERILTRTVAGYSVTGATFAPYSEGYRLAKGRIGASSRPNLQLSGEMLRAIVVEPDRDGVTLAFSS